MMGYSQGGGVALQLAIRHPSLVSKLVSMSATFRKDGWYPSVFEAIGGLSAEAFAATSVETAFKKHTPNAKAFDAYLEDEELEHRRSGHHRRGDAFDLPGLTPNGGHLTGGTAGPAGRMSVCRASVASTPRSFGSRLPAW